MSFIRTTEYLPIKHIMETIECHVCNLIRHRVIKYHYYSVTFSLYSIIKLSVTVLSIPKQTSVEASFSFYSPFVLFRKTLYLVKGFGEFIQIWFKHFNLGKQKCKTPKPFQMFQNSCLKNIFNFLSFVGSVEKHFINWHVRHCELKKYNTIFVNRTIQNWDITNIRLLTCLVVTYSQLKSNTSASLEKIVS